jgi:hypothetical protein
MFTKSPVLANEAKLIQSVQDFSHNVCPKDCNEILDTLFFEWLGSESCDCTSPGFRSEVAHTYKELKNLLSIIDQNSKGEVSND